MKVLVINAGSSSLKYQLINMLNEEVLAKGVVERIGINESFLKHKANNEEVKIHKTLTNHAEAIELVFNTLTNKENGIINSLNEINAVGHRVVHGGEDYKNSVLVTDEVLKVIKANSDLAPLHMPANIMGIEAVKKVAPNLPNVAVFDTAFHSNMPKHAFMYALNQDVYKNHKVRRYGFHGTSHYYVANRLASLESKPLKDLKIVTCHLGGGASLAAVKDGISIDTSMGFTPLEGLMMGTRSGDIDPAIHQYLMSKMQWNIDELTSFLNKKSGLLGISGVSSDLRDIREAAPKNADAKLAIEMFIYKIKKYIGAYAASMGGLDAVVFTAGIGTYEEIVREKVIEGLEFLGLELNVELNNNLVRDKETKISKPGSKAVIYVIPTNEELVIARDTKKIVDKI